MQIDQTRKTYVLSVSDHCLTVNFIIEIRYTNSHNIVEIRDLQTGTFNFSDFRINETTILITTYTIL